jgi:hypothetical protein
MEFFGRQCVFVQQSDASAEHKIDIRTFFNATFVQMAHKKRSMYGDNAAEVSCPRPQRTATASCFLTHILEAATALLAASASRFLTHILEAATALLAAPAARLLRRIRVAAVQRDAVALGKRGGRRGAGIGHRFAAHQPVDLYRKPPSSHKLEGTYPALQFGHAKERTNAEIGHQKTEVRSKLTGQDLTEGLLNAG